LQQARSDRNVPLWSDLPRRIVLRDRKRLRVRVLQRGPDMLRRWHWHEQTMRYGMHGKFSVPAGNAVLRSARQDGQVRQQRHDVGLHPKQRDL
jgi:hypothetical protein